MFNRLCEKKWLCITLLLIISIATHFTFFGTPDSTVFDEVHFGKFISGYYTHQYYFDIHPPLGKLIIAGFAKLFDFRPEFSFTNIGDKFPDDKYMALRFLPSLAGTLLPLVIFLLALEMSFSRKTAFFTGLLIAFENALITQSRYILLDSFLLLFGFSALLFYFLYRNHGYVRHLFYAGLLASLAISVKWTGLAFLGIIGLIELYEIIKKRDSEKIFRNAVFLAAIPLLVYFSVFAVHFSLLNKTGTGDAFMSAGFQKTLKGSIYQTQDIKTPDIFSKFTELNSEMYRSNQRLTATHAYGSRWYTWPFMTRPIYYWISDNARIYLIGNPVIWWLSTIAVLTLVGYMLTGELRKDIVAWTLFGGYVINLLPFVGISRVMFLYHYLTALIFAILMMGYLISRMTKQSEKWFGVIIILAVGAFVFFAPLTYGLRMTESQYNARVWLESWR